MLTRFFARRYLFSPKSRSVINVIAGVSVLSFAMPVAAMIVLLSVLNGFGDFAKSMSSAFDADLTVAPREGQTFASAEIDSLALTRVKGVGVVSYLLEQQVLLERDGLQTMATLRGVDDRYTEVFPIEETIPLGSWSVRTGDLDRLVLGRDMARTLGIRSLVRAEVAVYALRRGSFSSLLPVDGYSVRRLDVGGLFFLDLESENEYALTSLRAAQELFDRPGRISAISVRVADGADAEKVRREIAGIVGDDFTVRTRDEMNALFFRLVAYEKWGRFLHFAAGPGARLVLGSRDPRDADDRETGRCGHAACPGRRYEAHSFDLRRRRTPDRRSGGVDRSRAGRRLLPGTATFRNDSHPGRYVVVIQLSRRDALERFADRCGGFRGGNSGDFGADRAECDEKQQTMI